MDLEEQLNDRYGGWECACHGNVHVTTPEVYAKVHSCNL